MRYLVGFCESTKQNEAGEMNCDKFRYQGRIKGDW